MNKFFKIILVLVSLAFLASCGSSADENVVNVYTHRHYKSDDNLFAAFTKETGIKVNVVNATADELMQRLETEGKNSNADILITVDAGRLYRAQSRDLLQPVSSEILDANVPANFKEENGYWYAMTYRARIIAYSKDRVNPDDIQRYEDLADPRWKNKILVRSSEHVYNQSLLASIILANGEEKAQEWVNGVVANMARNPKGSDRDQVKAVAAGEGDLAIVNTYYVGLMLNDENPEERKAAEQVGIIFPNQDDRGTHVNVSGVAVTKYAPHKENAIKLIEFLTGEVAQRILSGMNYEFPINSEIPQTATIKSWGDFKKDDVSLYKIGEYNTEAVKLFDKAGWN